MVYSTEEIGLNLKTYVSKRRSAIGTSKIVLRKIKGTGTREGFIAGNLVFYNFDY